MLTSLLLLKLLQITILLCLADFTSISDVQVLLQDENGSIIGVQDASTFLPLAKATFSDIGTGTITAVSALKLLANAVMDVRVILLLVLILLLIMQLFSWWYWI
ncbi:MAG: hypothetical protein Q9M43_00205 [Sulfurimonas sp.]|nr:hypothetical protein [Sulfurimonas sp.]